MRKLNAIGLGVGVATLILGVLYWMQSDDGNSSANTNGANIQPVSVPIAEPDLHQGSPAQANSRIGFAAARTESSQPRILQGPFSEEFTRLAKSLRLRADEHELLLDILSQESNRIREWRVANRRTFFSEEETRELRKDSDRLVLELLGSDRFRIYDDYRSHPAERKQIDRFNDRLVSSGANGLTQALDNQLYAALKEAATRSPAPRLSAYESHLDYEAALKQWREEYMARFQQRAASMLTTDQLTLLQNLPR
jgi:hypothetical protein